MTLLKITYMDGDTPHIIRAYILSEDDHFILVKTEKNKIRIGKKYIITIKEALESEDNEQFN